MRCQRHDVEACGLCQGAILIEVIKTRGDVDRDAVRDRLSRIHPRKHETGFDSCSHPYCATVREYLTASR